MHFDHVCAECSAAGRFEFVKIPLREDGVYEHVCPLGHRSVWLTQQHRFELLFELGIHAILDGYYREAISAFSAALERFYQFSFHVLTLRSGASDANFLEAWAQVKKSSERQFGVHVSAWLISFGSIPRALPDSGPNKPSKEFRNNVIHNGMLPDYAATVAFGQTVLEITREQIDHLNDHAVDEVRQVTHYHLREAAKKSTSPVPTTRWSMTILSLQNRDYRVGVEEYLEVVKQQRKLMPKGVFFASTSPGVPNAFAKVPNG